MFHVGDKVFYPMHGAGIIHGIEHKKILGEIREYLMINIPSTQLNVMIPKNRAESAGLRPLSDIQTVKSVLQLIRQKQSPDRLSWKERLRTNSAKLKSGEFLQTAEAFNDLFYRNKEKPLNTSEKELLNDAQKFLISELCMIKNIDEQEAEQLLINGKKTIG